jgi:hypothetical protein
LLGHIGFSSGKRSHRDQPAPAGRLLGAGEGCKKKPGTLNPEGSAGTDDEDDHPMTTTKSHANGQERQTLASQIDRLDSILDGLSEALSESVSTAVQEAVSLAVKEAVHTVLTEVLTNPELRDRLQPPCPPLRSRRNSVQVAAKPAMQVNDPAEVPGCLGARLVRHPGGLSHLCGPPCSGRQRP